MPVRCAAVGKSQSGSASVIGMSLASSGKRQMCGERQSEFAVQLRQMQMARLSVPFGARAATFSGSS